MIFVILSVLLITNGILIFKEFRLNKLELEKLFPYEMFNEKRETVTNLAGKKIFINRIHIVLKENVPPKIINSIAFSVNSEIILTFPELNIYEIKLLNCERLFNYNKNLCLEDQAKTIEILKHNPNVESVYESQIASPLMIQ